MSGDKEPTIFISYSHKDEEWKDRLRPHLKLLDQAGLNIIIWDDRAIDGGAQWYDDIKKVIQAADASICLISADYLASDFCTKEEIPDLLLRRETDGMLLLPILIRPCAWWLVPWLAKTQMLPRDGKSVAIDFEKKWDEVFTLVAATMFKFLNDPHSRPAPPPPRWPPPEEVDISRLPATGAELFGRQKELQLLDAAWESDGTHVVSLVAWGGVGKTTLVNRWSDGMAADNYRGARRVFAWSFYSQGMSERATSADKFINDALEWFGDTDSAAGSPWDKGERLARLVQQEKTLLLLDGLEPLQSPLAHERGRIKDPALVTLLVELARKNPGLCVITTREPVTDLARFAATAPSTDLEQISDEAGRALLRVGGARGTDAELEQAVRDFGNHAFAVNLLPVYLRAKPGHHVSHATEIPDLDIPEEAGRHPRRVMAAIAGSFGDGPELQLLRLLGFFDRPADEEMLGALRDGDIVHDLNHHLHAVSAADWPHLVEKLRRSKLIAPARHHDPPREVDAHPLVREHFGEELKRLHPDAWREGHKRLFNHLRNKVKNTFPESLEEMFILYTAVAHGCRAGEHESAFGWVYYIRIQRAQRFFSANMLVGSVSLDLATLSCFFPDGWDEPVTDLEYPLRALLLGQAGYRLWMLGMLKEAITPMRKALSADEEQASKAATDEERREALKYASVDADTFASIHLARGLLPDALEYSERAVDHAFASEDTHQMVSTLNTKGDIQHHMGEFAAAKKTFEFSEETKNKCPPPPPPKKRREKGQKPSTKFHNPLGHRYCDLLLSLGKYSEAGDDDCYSKARDKIDSIMKAEKDKPEEFNLIDIALSHLLLGRAQLSEAGRRGAEDLGTAKTSLDEAMRCLRRSGRVVHFPRGLMALADWHMLDGSLPQALARLEDALDIATAGGMKLHEADCHLRYARLYLMRAETQRARESWAKAKALIGEIGYHLRDKDVQELDGQLKAAGV